MNAGRRVGGARSAGDEADAGRSGRLADRLGHHGGAAFLPAHRDRKRAIVEGVERRQIALAGHAKHMRHAVDDELIDQDLRRGSCFLDRAHASQSFPADGGRLQISEILRPDGFAPLAVAAKPAVSVNRSLRAHTPKKAVSV